MRGLGLEVNLSKSIISRKGLGFEFAKRTVIFRDEARYDISPIPFKEYSAALDSSASLVSFFRKYNPNLGTIKSILGLGYKSGKSKRLRLFQIAMSSPSNAQDFLNILVDIGRLGPRENPRLVAIGKIIFDLAHDLHRKSVKDVESLSALQHTWREGVDYPDLQFKGTPVFKGNLESEAKKWKLDIYVPSTLLESVHTSLCFGIDALVRGNVAARHMWQYQCIISDMIVLKAEILALPKLEVVLDEDPEEFFMAQEDIRSQYINTIAYWVPIFFQ